MMMVGMAVLSLALFTMVNSSSKAQKSTREQINSRYVAEAGLSVAMMQLSRGAAAADVASGSLDHQVQFGNASYWVAADDLGGNLFELTATGVENNVGSQLTLVVREITDNVHVWAAFGDEGLTMDSNAQVDSYNSNLGTTYEDQDVNGSGSNSYALENGNVGSNNNISLDSNVKVHGDATPGPSGTTAVAGSVYLSGSTTPASAEVEMPPLVLPAIASTGDMDFDGSGSGAFHDFIPAGDHHFDNVEVSMSGLTVFGPATLVFESFTMRSNSELLIDATGGPVEIYVVGDFVMNSKTLLASIDRIPSHLTINLLSDNVIDPLLEVDLDEVDFDSNAKLYGSLYAPNASVDINSNFELFGSLVARRVHLDSNARIHFDEALLTSSSTGQRRLETVAWQHRPYHP